MGEAKRRNIVHLEPKPVDPLRTISKNDLYRILVETQIMLFEMRADIEKINSIHQETIKKEIDRQFGERVKYVDEILRDVIVQKEVFYEKGFITRQEMTQKLRQMAEKDR